jgi:hypothetical protein
MNQDLITGSIEAARIKVVRDLAAEILVSCIHGTGVLDDGLAEKMGRAAVYAARGLLAEVWRAEK